MFRHKPISSTVGAVILAMSTGFATPQVVAEEFDEADVFFELNHTDEDLGLHAMVDGEPWRRVRIQNEASKQILDLRVRRALRQQGMTELFFESHEPDFDELSPAAFFARFPAGDYTIKGWTLDGGVLVSTDALTHAMPAPPEVVTVDGMDAAEDCDAELPEVTPPITIAWSSVGMSHPDLGIMPPVPIEVTGYQLVVEMETEDEDEFVLSVDLPSEATEFTIPEDFTALPAADDVFKFEILVREDSGNQTAIESCFVKVAGD